MSFARSQIYTHLTDSSVTALLTDGADGVYYGHILPEDTGSTDSAILYYRGVVPRGQQTMEIEYIVNCYAATEGQAETLAETVKEVIDGVYTGGRAYRVEMLETIPQPSLTDGFNSPLVVHTWGRDFS